MAVKITIGGLDYTQYVDLKTVKVDSNIAVNSDTAEFNVIIPQQVLPRPKGGQEVIIWNGSNKEFAGVVLLTHEEALAPDRMNYDVKCRDYVYWLDKRLVVNSYTNMSAGNIVIAIIQNFTTGFTANHVLGTDSSFNIPFIKFDHVPVSEALKKLADAVGYDWWIDYNKDIHFGPINTSTSPLPGNQLLPDIDTANYSDLYIEEDVSQVRNQIYFLGHKVAAQYQITEKFVGDGQRTQFHLNYEPSHTLTQTIVKQGSTNYPTKYDVSDGNATSTTNDGKAYIHFTNQTVRFNVAPANGTVVSVTYRPRYEMVNMYNDPNGMNIMKQRDGMDGVYEYMIRDQQLSGDDTSLVDTRGRIELTKYAYPHITGEFYSFLQGWQTGQYFMFTSNNRMDGQLQNVLFYVTKIEKMIVSHPANGKPTFYYKIDFSDSPYIF